VIVPIPANGRTDLPADFFHFVFTHYVLEHVADIDAVTREIATSDVAMVRALRSRKAA